jgi:hypothetical protein
MGEFRGCSWQSLSQMDYYDDYDYSVQVQCVLPRDIWLLRIMNRDCLSFNSSANHPNPIWAESTLTNRRTPQFSRVERPKSPQSGGCGAGLVGLPGTLPLGRLPKHESPQSIPPRNPPQVVFADSGLTSRRLVLTANLTRQRPGNCPSTMTT